MTIPTGRYQPVPVSGEAFRATLGDPLLLSFFDYWSARRAPGRLPGRQDIDPIEMRPWLKHLVLADVVDGKRLRYRLAGTEMVERWGADFTGRFLEDVMSGTYLEYIATLYWTVVRRGAPVMSSSRFRWDLRRAAMTRRLIVPLARDGRTVDMTMSCQVFDTNVEPAGVGRRLDDAEREDLPSYVEAEG